MKTYINDTKNEVEIVFNSNGEDKEQRHIIKNPVSQSPLMKQRTTDKV